MKAYRTEAKKKVNIKKTGMLWVAAAARRQVSSDEPKPKKARKTSPSALGRNMAVRFLFSFVVPLSLEDSNPRSAPRKIVGTRIIKNMVQMVIYSSKPIAG